MTAKIEWDTEAANTESASVGSKLLNHVVPLYNKLVDIATKFQAVTDLDAAAADAVQNMDDEESVTYREQIEKARKLIEHHEAALLEKARKTLMADIDPDFDEAKVKAAYNDTKVELKKNLANVRETFKLLGFVDAELSPAGRESNWTAKTPDGETLISVMDIPKLEGTKETGGASEAVKEFNREAKEWGRKNGFKVADKGALSTEVKEAYSKATGKDIPA
jgi:dihydroneopterin aldolase